MVLQQHSLLTDLPQTQFLRDSWNSDYHTGCFSLKKHWFLLPRASVTLYIEQTVFYMCSRPVMINVHGVWRLQNTQLLCSLSLVPMITNSVTVRRYFTDIVLSLRFFAFDLVNKGGDTFPFLIYWGWHSVTVTATVYIQGNMSYQIQWDIDSII